MNKVDEIRAEQNAQIKAPKKPYQSLIQAVSNILHPLLMLTYAAIAICVFTPMTVMPFQLKALFVGEVFFYTMILPALAITLLHVFHIIGHWALRDRRDRYIPFLVNFICYSLNYYALTRMGLLPNWILTIYFGSVILTFIAWIVSFWWKISAHASADAATATTLFIIYSWFPETTPLWLCLVSIVLVGIVCSTRVYLGRHTLAQVGVGSAMGVFSMLMALWFNN